jgi:hypothetical protein
MSELTRRDWLLRIGGTTVATGIGPTALDATDPAPLPPGLYEPSLDHLAHQFLAVTKPANFPPEPQYFSSEDFALVQSLAALILGEEPATPPVPEITAWIDLIVGRSAAVRAAALALSPTHRRLAADRTGEEAVRKLETDDPQATCKEGLTALKSEGFATLDKMAQLSLLETLEDADDPFVAWLKRQVLTGFYTSKEGLKELDYKGNSFYSISPGCDHQPQ